MTTNDTPYWSTKIALETLFFAITRKGDLRAEYQTSMKRAATIKRCSVLLERMIIRQIIKNKEITCIIPRYSNWYKVRTLAPRHSALIYRRSDRCMKYELVYTNRNGVDVLIPGGLLSTFSISPLPPSFYENHESKDASNVNKTCVGAKRAAQVES